jgi:hypothetical protein
MGAITIEEAIDAVDNDCDRPALRGGSKVASEVSAQGVDIDRDFDVIGWVLNALLQLT